MTIEKLIPLASFDHSVDRLHSLTEANPKVEPMPPLLGGAIITPVLALWISKNYHYLKRVEEAMPDLLIAANEFVSYACDQEVSDRLCGTVTLKKQVEDSINEIPKNYRQWEKNSK